MSEKPPNRVIELRRSFHAIPELAFEEWKTAGLAADFLRNNGFSVREAIAGTGLIADSDSKIESEGSLPLNMQIIALRSDMDGLALHESCNSTFMSRHPGLMHACGHDANLACILDAAARLSLEIPGITTRVIVQPADEIEGEGDRSGAGEMIEAGALKGVGAIIGMHVDATIPSGQVQICTNFETRLACRFEFELTIEPGSKSNNALLQKSANILSTLSTLNNLSTDKQGFPSPFDDSALELDIISIETIKRPKQAENRNPAEKKALHTTPSPNLIADVESFDKLSNEILDQPPYQALIQPLNQLPDTVIISGMLNHREDLSIDFLNTHLQERLGKALFDVASDDKTTGSSSLSEYKHLWKESEPTAEIADSRKISTLDMHDSNCRLLIESMPQSIAYKSTERLLFQSMEEAARNLLGTANTKTAKRTVWSKSFSRYAAIVPAVFLNVGVELASSRRTHHSSTFDINEAALSPAVDIILAAVELFIKSSESGGSALCRPAFPEAER